MMVDVYMKEDRGKLMNEPTKTRAKVAFLVLRREPVDRILFHLSPKKLDFEFATPSIYPPSNEESLSLVKNAQIIVTDIMITREILDRANDLRFIQQLGAGVEKIDFTALRGKDIYVANTSGGNATAVAEHTMALILALAKKIIILNNFMSNGEFPNLWDESKPGIVELKGKSLGIVGLGSIGTAIAEIAKAFGMRLLAVKRHKSRKGDIELDFIGGPEDLEFLLKKSDFCYFTSINV